MSNEFPAVLKLNRLAFGSNVLTYMRQQPDLGLGPMGEKLQPILAGYRAILPEHLDQYYEMLTGVITHLERWSSLCESCSKSGAYRDKRQEQLNVLLTLLTEIEAQEPVLELFNSMRVQ